VTAQAAVYLWADNRHKNGIIKDQAVRIAGMEHRLLGAESIARQTVELLNRYGMALHRIK
jgi:hypothetical protein